MPSDALSIFLATGRTCDSFYSVSVFLLIFILTPLETWKSTGLFLAVTLCSTLILAEGMLRLLSAGQELLRPALGERFESPHPVEGSKDATLGQILRSGPSVRRPFRLKPNLAVTFKGARVSTNERGERRTPVGSDQRQPGGIFPPRAVLSPKQPAAMPFEDCSSLPSDVREPLSEPTSKFTANRTVTILGIGDSVMFGWGVNDRETYLSQLVSSLQRDYPSVGWRARNTAVPGYNTTNEVEALEEVLDTETPDLVLLHFTGNDLDIADPLRSNTSSLDRNSFLRRFIRTRSLAKTLNPPVVTSFGQQATVLSIAASRRLPARYRDQGGVPGFEKAMSHFAELTGRRGIPTLVVTHGPIPDFLQRIAKDLGLEVVSSWTASERWAAERGWANSRVPPLSRSATDPHPSALHHCIQAQVIRTALLDRNITQGILVLAGFLAPAKTN